jgi:hypothetical protein
VTIFGRFWKRVRYICHVIVLYMYVYIIHIPIFLRSLYHSDYRTVSPYWVLPVYVELIGAVWADDGDKTHLF